MQDSDDSCRPGLAHHGRRIVNGFPRVDHHGTPVDAREFELCRERTALELPR